MRRLLLAFVVFGGLGTPKTHAQEAWPEQPEGFVGSMSYTFLAQANPSGGVKPPQVTHDITIKGLRPQAVFVGRRVRFGPFRVSTSYSTQDQAPLPTFQPTFVVRVLGRSPQQIDPLADLTELARVSRTLKPTRSGELVSGEFFVDADLPGALSALALEATIDPPTFGPPSPLFTRTYPDDLCRQRLNGDQFCLQSGINPLGVAMALVPISIVYEPPGQCSWASTTTSETTSVRVSVEDANAQKTQVLRDVVVLGGAVQDEHTDTTWSNEDRSQKGSEVKSTISSARGTELAGHSALDCRSAPDRRATRGPGKGDLFLLATNAPVVYWNAANLSNSRHLLLTQKQVDDLDPDDRPGTVQAFAYQLAGDAEKLSPSLRSKSRRDLDAILGLDPLTAARTTNANAPVTVAPHIGLPPSRYAWIWKEELQPDNYADVMRENSDARYSVEATTNSVENHKKVVTEDAAVVLSNTMVQFGTRAGLAAATGAASEWLFGLDDLRKQCKAAPGSSACKEKTVREGAVSDIQDAVNEKSLPAFFQDRTETRINTVVTQSKAVARTETSKNLQSFFLRDPNRSLNVAVYYDLIFGTFAFDELPAGMGTLATPTRVAMSDGGVQRGQSAWIKTVAAGTPVSLAFPDAIATQLRGYANGRPFSLVPLAPDAFTAAPNKIAGLPAGVIAGPTGLTGNTSAAPGVYQQPFLVQDDQGANGGVLWQTVVVSKPGAFDSAVCQRRSNPDQPGTDIVTCCTLAGQCDSFVAPSGDQGPVTRAVEVAVVDASGLPVNNQHVYVNSEAGSPVADGWTLPNGRVTLSVPVGDLGFVTMRDGRLYRATCSALECSQVTLAFDPSVLVTVTDYDGNPQNNVHVYANAGPSNLNEGWTLPDGTVSLALSPGDATFAVSHDGKVFSATCSVPECKAVTLKYDPSILVTVTDYDGNPQYNVHVYANSGPSSVAQGWTGVDGTVALPLSPGNATFAVSHAGRSFYATCSIPGCKAVTIKYDPTVRVSVVDRDGNPQFNQHIYVSSDGVGVNEGWTDENGVVTLAASAGNLTFTMARNNRYYAESCVACREVRIILERPVRAQVVNSGGTPQYNQLVSVLSGTTIVAQGWTLTDGSVVFDLPAGAYVFAAAAAGTSYYSEACSVPGCSSASVVYP